MKIEFRDRNIVNRSFSAYVANGMLCLPRIFEPLCETQGLATAEHFLEFAKKDPTTVGVLLENDTMEKYWEAVRYLESMLHASPPPKSDELTPTAPPVDSEADTPLAPNTSLYNETTAA